MRLSHDADLRPCNTFGISVRTHLLAEIEHGYEVEQVVSLAERRNLPLLVLGAGSNVLLRRDYAGVVLRIASRGIGVLREQGNNVWVRVAAGEIWHNVVAWAARQNFWGIENLALIPGWAGAAPMQNIGAYGAELSDTLQSILAYDRRIKRWVTIEAADSAFGYRRSRFKDDEPERYIIAELLLRLHRHGAAKLDYPGVRDALAILGKTMPSPANMVETISQLRRRRLPDPAISGNAGSFFKNPIVSAIRYRRLAAEQPELPAHVQSDGTYKLSAAWLIEQCGWKGMSKGSAGVSSKHALVLVNLDRASGAEIWRLAQRIQESVYRRFGLRLEPEPQVI